MWDRAPILPVRGRLAACGLGLLLASGSLFAQAPPPEPRVPRNDAFPLTVGNSWTYSGVVWWTPANTRRILKEQVNWEIEVDEVIERPGFRAAVLKGLPNDLVLLGTGRARDQFLFVQVGEDRLYLLRGQRLLDTLERLRDRNDTLENLVHEAELVLDLPLFVGKSFCPEVPEAGRRGDQRRGCWIVREQESFSLASIRGLHGTRDRFTIDLTSPGDHVVWGFVPGIGLTSFAIGHFGSVSAVELDLVAAHVEGYRPIVFLKTLDLQGGGVAAAAPPPVGSSTAASRPGGAGAGTIRESTTPEGAKPEPARPAPTSEPPKPAPPRDGDRDGVVDPRDLCANTPAGTEVDAYGCEVVRDADGDGVVDPRDLCADTPAGATVDAYGCEVVRDADGDGVVDPRDLCAGTPAGAEVDAHGCEIVRDADEDGVVDPRDLCPDTPAGAEVDTFGCEIVRDADDDGVVDPRDRCPDTPADEPVDERGCPPPEPPAPEPAAVEPPAPEPATPQPRPAEPETVEPEPRAAKRPAIVETPVSAPADGGPDLPACVDSRDWFLNADPIEFEGRSFEPSGQPEPISLANLVIVGDYAGVPIFVGSTLAPPYSELWLPFCSPAGSYQLYQEAP